MTKYRNRLPFFTFLPFLSLMVFSFAITVSSTVLAKTYTAESTDPILQSDTEYTPSDVNDILSDLNDSEVRQLLKQELNKNASGETGSLLEEIPGPGTFLSSMLDSLLAISSDTKSRFGEMLMGFPKILPDLYKIFLTL